MAYLRVSSLGHQSPKQHVLLVRLLSSWPNSPCRTLTVLYDPFLMLGSFLTVLIHTQFIHICRGSRVNKPSSPPSPSQQCLPQK
uniref:Uncharacterized protein n=1 Tax=Arundo donax TaxID=35708 RepID=A0A0A9DHV8_ARUDO